MSAANKSPIIRVTSAHSVDSTRSSAGQVAQIVTMASADTDGHTGELDGCSNKPTGGANSQDQAQTPRSSVDEDSLPKAPEQRQHQYSVTFEQMQLRQSVSNESSDAAPSVQKPTRKSNATDGDDAGGAATHAYGMRWFVLAIFCSHSAVNSFQWIQYAIISNIISSYYGVSNREVSLTSMVYMITYIPFIIHASLMLDRVGLRAAVCLGAAGTAVGSLVKLMFGAAATPQAFWAMMVGQTIVALSQLYIISIPPLLAAVWFPDHQVSTATGIGVFGNQLGIALGCIVPPWWVSGHDAPQQQIGQELYSLSLWLTLVSIAIGIVAFACLKDKPPKPPGSASLHAEHQQKQEHHDATTIRTSSTSGNTNNNNGSMTIVVDDSSCRKMETFAFIGKLCRDRDFGLLTISYGINVGVFYAISTVLNQLLAKRLTNPDELSGTMGLLIVVSGMAGSVMCGQLLDRTHAYKLIIVLIYLLSLVSMLIFTLILRVSATPWALYVASTTLGYFMTGYLPLGFEFAAEITYPHPANTPAGLLNLSAQVFGLTLTYVSSDLVEIVDGDLWTNIFLTGCLAIGLALTVIMKANLRRQKAVAEEQMKM